MSLDVSELIVAVGGELPEPDTTKIEQLRMAKELEIPKQLTNVELWANFCNDELYEMDKLFRKFLLETQWSREKNGGQKVTASLVFAYLFGRKPGPSDGSVCRLLHKVMMYYCTSYKGRTTFQGQKVERLYIFSKYTAKNANEMKRPISLRLRLEERDKYGPNRLWAKGPDAYRDKREVRRRNRKDGSESDGGDGSDS